MRTSLGLDVAIDRALAGETVTAEAVPHVEPDGTPKYCDRLHLPLRGSGGAVVGMVAIVRDVTTRRNAEEALRGSEEKRRMAAEAAGVGFWSWDTRTDLVTWDDTMCAIFGKPRGARSADSPETPRRSCILPKPSPFLASCTTYPLQSWPA